MATPEQDDEREARAAARVAKTIAEFVAVAYAEAPARGLYALIVAAEALAVGFVQQHPEERANVLAVLRAMVGNVDAMTGARH